MSGELRRTIEELVQPEASLPSLCNVIGRLQSAPQLIHQKWVLELTGMSGAAKALVAVHEQPPPELKLGYEHTAPELLELFRQPELLAGFVPGDLVLAQGVPKRGVEGLWLNVQAILLVRPHRLFGRNQIDLASECPRRSYLAVTKGLRGAGSSGFHAGSVAGNVVHDLYSSWAVASAANIEDGGWDLQSKTLLDLLFLGLRSPKELQHALRAGERLRDTVKSEPKLQDVIARGPWIAESTALNNGVSVSPDLLRKGAVVELKHIRKDSPHNDPEEQRRQLESYLAWAMVEYGLPVVIDNRWSALLVQLHPTTPAAERIKSIDPNPTMVAQRILRRHRLLTLHQGRWLPMPGPECHYCAYGDRRKWDEPGSAPACEFYCQTERSWACQDDQGRRCPLLERCDQRHRWFEYSELDLVNRYRTDLASEEEEREVVSAVVQSLAGGSAAANAGLEIGGFQVAADVQGVLRLAVPQWAASFDFAVSGDTFELVRDGRSLGYVAFVKRKGTELHFAFSRKALETTPAGVIAPLEAGTIVALRIVPCWDAEPRDLLAFLDRRQRRGELSPFRPATATSLDVVQHATIAESGQFSDLTLVDVSGHRGARQALTQVIETAKRLGVGRVLLAGVERIGGNVPKEAVWIDPAELASELARSTRPIPEQLVQMVGAIQQSGWWCVTQQELHEERLPGVVETIGKIPLLVVLSAESLPVVTLSRCFELAERVVLVGQSMASGPRAEDARARRSELFQNTLSLLMAGALHVLPARVKSVETVVLTPEVSIPEVDRLGLPPGRQFAKMTWTEVPGARAQSWASGATVVLQTRVSTTSNTLKQLRLSLHPSENVSASTMRTLLRGVSAAHVEAVKNDDQGRIDRKILGHAVQIDLVGSHLRGPEDSGHTVEISIPVTNLRFVQERCYSSEAEADAVAAYLKEHSRDEVVVTSPFFAQCVLLARRIAATGSGNAKVVPFEQLGRKAAGSQLRSLAVSWVVGAAEFVYPSPLDDLGRLLEVCYGDWSSVHHFVSPEARVHHPVLNALSNAS